MMHSLPMIPTCRYGASPKASGDFGEHSETERESDIVDSKKVASMLYATTDTTLA